MVRIFTSISHLIGTVSVDLHTIATGPVEHNLPILDINEKVVGRLNFCVEMEHTTNVAAVFREVKLRELTPINGKECNPYLKYAYSLHWPAVVEQKMKAFYSPVIYNTTAPEWTDLPELRFKTTLQELLKESIVLHITHHGNFSNTTLGKCNVSSEELKDNFLIIRFL